MNGLVVCNNVFIIRKTHFTNVKTDAGRNDFGFLRNLFGNLFSKNQKIFNILRSRGNFVHDFQISSLCSKSSNVLMSVWNTLKSVGNLTNRLMIENCKGFRSSLIMFGSCHICMNCCYRLSTPHYVKLVDNCFKFRVDDLPLFCMFGKVLLRLFLYPYQKMMH